MTPSSTFTPALAHPLHAPHLAVQPGSRVQRLLLAGGATGPVLFAAAYTLEGLARPGYDPARETISALSLGSDGWLQVANFIVFGLLSILSAPAWRAALAPGRGAAAIPIAKVAIGMGLILAGIFDTAPADAAVVELGGILHNIASCVALGATWVSTFLFAARFAREPGWRWWAVVAVISGAAAILLLAGLGIATTHHTNVGVFERLASLPTVAFSLAVAVRVLARRGRVSLDGERRL
ncbi:MAG: DUF998 domain-containing protein [Chloroflexota bacterium]|nr:DUF998 domain-containing protein [Chloroflexota bacterium]